MPIKVFLENNMNQATVIIADLHLSEDTPKLNAKFHGCLKEWQGKINALYILGDLFEVWVGDDDSSPFIEEQLAALKAFSAHTPLFIMHGNRDFLLGDTFAAQVGATMLPDPYPVILHGKSYVLTHGDILCSEDLAYQQFRLQARNPLWQAAMLAKPLAERHILAAQIRQMSEGKKAADGKSTISDATEAGVQELMKNVSGSQEGLPTLIHGHTHRPAIHEHQFNNQAFKRYVIADWFESEDKIEGGFLKVDAMGVEVEVL